MTRRPEAKLQRPAARLYLVTPRGKEPSVLARALDEMLDAADVAAVLLRLPAGEERALIESIKAVAPVVQERGVALLLDGHADIVARANVDGAHLTGIDAFTGALDRLKPDRIAGAGGLQTRHDAMKGTCPHGRKCGNHRGRLRSDSRYLHELLRVQRHTILCNHAVVPPIHGRFQRR